MTDSFGAGPHQRFCFGIRSELSEVCNNLLVGYNVLRPSCPIFEGSRTHKIMEDWNARKVKLKEQFTKLSEINSIENTQEQLISRLEKRLGASREAILKLLSELRIL